MKFMLKPARIVHWKSIVVGVGIPAAAGTALLLTLTALDIALACFVLAFAWLFYALTSWGVLTQRPFPWRLAGTGIASVALGVGLVVIAHHIFVAQAGPTRVWLDSQNGLMWANRDNGDSKDWQGSKEFCTELRLAGHSDWRLPNIDELRSVLERNGASNASLCRKYKFHGKYKASNAEINDCQEMENCLRGGLELNSCCAWSSTPATDSPGYKYFRFQPDSSDDDRERSFPKGRKALMRALCVRTP